MFADKNNNNINNCYDKNNININNNINNIININK